jgi:hypothetical protein
MGNAKPPQKPVGTPNTAVLTVGTVLFRVHQTQYAADDFNPKPCDRYYGGGRFDSTDDDRYSFLYAAPNIDVALSETFLRDLSPDSTGPRLLPVARVRGRRVSAVSVQADLELVSLCSGTDLGALSQDTWLTTCDPRDYAQSRHWGHWIRTHAPDACGFKWMSRREPLQPSYVLFKERMPANAIRTCSDPSLPSGNAAEFDTSSGKRYLRKRLSRYGVSLVRGRGAASTVA